MISLCEVCGKKVSTVGAKGVKLCRDCFDALRAEEDSALSLKFRELVNSRGAAARERRDLERRGLIEEKLREQKKLKQRKNFKEALKALFLGPLVFVVTLVVGKMCYMWTIRLAQELPGHINHPSTIQLILPIVARITRTSLLLASFVYSIYGIVGTIVGLMRLGSEPLHSRKAATLHDAATIGDLGRVKKLFKSGVPLDSVDFKGRTALHLAALQGHKGVVEFLIAKGADANVTDMEGHTPLSLIEDGDANSEILHLLGGP